MAKKKGNKNGNKAQQVKPVELGSIESEVVSAVAETEDNRVSDEANGEGTEAVNGVGDDADDDVVEENIGDGPCDVVKNNEPPTGTEQSEQVEQQAEQQPRQQENVTDLTSTEQVEQAEQKQPVAAPVPKKRLTLQERLALAAKAGKSSKRIASSSKAPNSDLSPVSSPSPPAPKLDAIKTETKDDHQESTDSPFKQNFREMDKDELVKFLDDVKNKFISLQSKNDSLKLEKHSLQEKMKTLSSERSSTPSLSSSNSVSDHLIKEQEAKIQQLMKEGEDLSKKELKLNNTIKQLKSTETENNYQITDLKETVKKLEEERSALKESLAKAQFEEKQSSLKSKALKKQLESEQSTLADEITRTKQLSLQVEELSETLILEKNKFNEDINGLKKQLESEKQKLSIAKNEHQNEISRLEEKIEQLRFQAEKAQTSTSKNDETYVRLLRQHDVLQKQYTSATENWQSIEAALMNRISTLENENASLNSDLLEAEQKSNILTKNLEEKSNEIDSLSTKLSKLTIDHGKVSTQLQNASKSLSQTQETLEELQINQHKEKAALEYKIQNLERQVQIQEQVQPQHLLLPESQGTPITFSSPNFSKNRSTSSLRLNRGGSWETREVNFGESSTTPLQSRKTSVAPLGYFDEQEDLDELEMDDEAESTFNEGSFKNSSSAIGGGSNVQLLSKMSFQVRRLQTELSTMKEEVHKLSNEKKSANEEIVTLMKDNEQVQEYKQRIAELETELSNSSTRNEEVLVILGEKTEQVEELKADVQDLKDMLRTQAQQFVELQSKLG